MRIVVDSYAWIEIFTGSRKGEEAKEDVQGAEEYTPGIVLAEVARKYMREGIEETAISERLKVVEETSEITSIDSRRT